MAPTDERVPWPRQTRAFARRAVRRFAKNRAALFWSVGAPVAFYLFFGVASAPDSQYTGVVRGSTALALGVFGSLNATLTVFSGNMGGDLRERRYRKLRSLPVSPSADVAGRFLAGLVVGVAAFLAVAAVGLATGATLAFRGLVSPLVVAVGLFAFCLVGVSLGVLSAAVVQDSQYLMVVGNAALLGLFYITGYNGVNPGLMPPAVHPLVNVLPNSLATRLTLVHLLPSGGAGGAMTPPPMPTEPGYIALLVGEAVLLCGLAAWAMRRVVYEGEVDE